MILNSGIKRVITGTKDSGYKIFNVEDWIKDWQKKDMLDDMDLYNAQYYVKEGEE